MISSHPKFVILNIDSRLYGRNRSGGKRGARAPKWECVRCIIVDGSVLLTTGKQFSVSQLSGGGCWNAVLR